MDRDTFIKKNAEAARVWAESLATSVADQIGLKGATNPRFKLRDKVRILKCRSTATSFVDAGDILTVSFVGPACIRCEPGGWWFDNDDLGINIELVTDSSELEQLRAEVARLTKERDLAADHERAKVLEWFHNKREDLKKQAATLPNFTMASILLSVAELLDSYADDIAKREHLK